MTCSLSAEALVAEDCREPAVRPLERRLHHVHRGAADEAADEEVHRLVVELLRRGDLLELPLAHDGDAVAHRHRLDLVVGDVDRGRVEVALQASDLRAHLHAELRVEVRERLVHEEGGGLADDRAAHRDALALAARERARLPLQELLEPEDLRGLVHALVHLVLRHLLDAQAERDVLVDREMRVERVALEDHRDVAVLRRDVVDDALADLEDALGDLLETRDHAKRRRLPAAGGADEHHELPVLDLQVEVVHRSCPVRVDLADLLEPDLGHAPLLRRYPAPYHSATFSVKEGR